MNLHTIDLGGKTAIITGGANGIGRRTAIACAQAGASIAIFDIDTENGKKVEEEIKAAGAKVLFLETDVSKEAMVKESAAKTVGAFGRIDILVNNAGITGPTYLEETSEEDWDNILAVNLKGPFLCIKHCLAHMKKNSFGRIVNISSIAAIAGGGLVGRAHYAASKAGLVAMTKAAAKHYGKFGITANAIAPGPIRTRLSESWVKVREKEVASTMPSQRIGEPEDIASAVLYLSSPQAGFITGQTFIVDGGMTIATAKFIV
jgi:NAD(P)-dependent dehydrogenase (short-subunit alcohol dehydrogenase family)